jgi:hypothetical protein
VIRDIQIADDAERVYFDLKVAPQVSGGRNKDLNNLFLPEVLVPSGHGGPDVHIQGVKGDVEAFIVVAEASGGLIGGGLAILRSPESLDEGSDSPGRIVEFPV